MQSACTASIPALRANETKSKKKPYIKDEILHGRSPRKRLRALDKGRRERTDGFGRRTNYNLQIINTLIQNGKKELFERIPQEVLRGMSEGRRRNVEASIVLRGNESPVRQGTGGLPSVTDRGEEIENDTFLRRDRQTRRMNCNVFLNAPNRGYSQSPKAWTGSFPYSKESDPLKKTRKGVYLHFEKTRKGVILE